MKIYKAYKYRLRLSKSQMTILDNYINTSRAVYNLALETKIYAYRSNKVNLSKFDLMRQLTECREEFEWIHEVPAQSLQDVIERMDKAYKSFFKGGGFPKWAKKDRYNSITFKSIKQIDDYIFKLPKIGTITIFKDRQPKGKLKTATISRNNNKYYISILTEQDIKPASKPNDKQVGIDMGIVFFASLSNGVQIDNPRHTLRYAKRLRIAQRSLARKKKLSNNWYKQKLVVSKLHEKLVNSRRDFLQKESTKIINEFGFVSIEDLKVKNMIKFGYLSKHIADASWSEFFRELDYKSKWNGNTFVKVNPKYTSQTCSHCGAIDKKSRISQSKFVCTSCGAEENADINASNNILSKGIAYVREREALACA